jgi:hypothetical protein
MNYAISYSLLLPLFYVKILTKELCYHVTSAQLLPSVTEMKFRTI